MSGDACSYRCGASAGESYFTACNVTWPLARVTVSDSMVRVTFPFHDITVPRSDVTQVSRFAAPFSQGVKVWHSMGTAPRFLVIWTFSPHLLLDAFRQRGYRVCEEGDGP